MTEKPRYCTKCGHAEWVHDGSENIPPAKDPTSCRLCVCKRFEDDDRKS